MKEINFKKVVQGQLEDRVKLLTEALKAEGFGVLTRIDFDCKIKEKLGKDLNPVVVLGACHPQLAYEAYLRNTDVSSLIPCNAVIRELEPNKLSIELMKPSAMMEVLGDQDLVELAKEADSKLKRALD
jgi:uncharacterized protein (DUF302 family)